MRNRKTIAATALIYISISVCTFAQEEQKPVANDAAALAKTLANPIGAMISMPFQNNMDVGIGAFNGSRNTMNFQPIIPFDLNEKFNLITRYIVPVIAQQDITTENTQQFGLADALVSAWISNAKVKNGVVWGVGSAFLIPTATNDWLGSKKFGLGPTAILLKQTNGWTYGGLINQVWSVAGSEDGTDVNQMYLQPFVTYNWKTGTGLTVNTELTHYWNTSQTNAFVNIMAGGILKFGKQIIQAQVGPRIQVAATDGNQAAFGVRTALIFVFPKG